MENLPPIIAAISALLLAAQVLQALVKAHSWVRVEARVLDKWVEPTYRRTSMAQPAVLYKTRYEVEYYHQGRRWRGETLGWRDYAREPDARAELKKHRFGSMLVIHVNPRKPDEIEIGHAWRLRSLTPILPAVLLVAAMLASGQLPRIVRLLLGA